MILIAGDELEATFSIYIQTILHNQILGYSS